MKTNDKKKKKLLGAAAALALLAALSGTFAWLSAQDQKINRVETAPDTGDVVIVEDWQPTPIIPGGSATKEVKVTNTGQNRVYVRASFEEVLKHLVSLGVKTDTATPTTYDPATASLTDDVPVPFAGDEYTTTNGWKDISTQVGVSGGTKVWAKGDAKKDPVTNQITSSFEYVTFYEYTIGTDKYYQEVQMDISVASGNEIAPSDVTNWTYNATAPKYMVYAGGYEYLTASWAESAFASPFDTTGTTTGYALLGYAGNKDGVAFDYLTGTIGTLPTHAANPAYPTTPTNDVKGIVTDRKPTFGGTDGGIDIGYSNKITDVSSLTSDCWVYNKEDGWFYYTAVLEATTTTNPLMDKLIFNKFIDDRYTNAIFDLDVKMEAIQATPEALSDAVGWGMNATGGGDTQTIHDFLANL